MLLWILIGIGLYFVSSVGYTIVGERRGYYVGLGEDRGMFNRFYFSLYAIILWLPGWLLAVGPRTWVVNSFGEIRRRYYVYLLTKEIKKVYSLLFPGMEREGISQDTVDAVLDSVARRLKIVFHCQEHARRLCRPRGNDVDEYYVAIGRAVLEQITRTAVEEKSKFWRFAEIAHNAGFRTKNSWQEYLS